VQDRRVAKSKEEAMKLVRPAAVTLAACLSATVLAGCSGGSSPSAGASPSPSLFTPSPCPTPATKVATKWPSFLPSDLPKPTNATIRKTTTTPDGVHVVQFMTPTSLRESVLFIVGAYPKAGYVLGRGDAEATEADAPFVHGEIRGITRISQLQQCQTLWLTATVHTGGVTSPLLPSRTPTSSASPLPFG
jgi:hypothetical protein